MTLRVPCSSAPFMNRLKRECKTSCCCGVWVGWHFSPSWAQIDQLEAVSGEMLCRGPRVQLLPGLGIPGVSSLLLGDTGMEGRRHIWTVPSAVPHVICSLDHLVTWVQSNWHPQQVRGLLGQPSLKMAESGRALLGPVTYSRDNALACAPWGESPTSRGG